METIDEADLVIFTEVRDIERNFSKEKSKLASLHHWVTMINNL